MFEFLQFIRGNASQGEPIDSDQDPEIKASRVSAAVAHTQTAGSTVQEDSSSVGTELESTKVSEDPRSSKRTFWETAQDAILNLSLLAAKPKAGGVPKERGNQQWNVEAAADRAICRLASKLNSAESTSASFLVLKRVPSTPQLYAVLAAVCIRERKHTALRYLVELGISLTDSADDEGRIPAHVASLEGNDEALSILAVAEPNGFDVPEQGGSLRTPLHFAALEGHEHCLNLLVEHGADLGAVDANFQLPIHIAMRAGQFQAVQVLLEMHSSNSKCSLPLSLRNAACRMVNKNCGSACPPWVSDGNGFRARHFSEMVYSKRLKLLRDGGHDESISLPTDILRLTVCYFDPMSFAAASAASIELKEACRMDGAQLWKALTLKRFPIVGPIAHHLPEDCFREQYRKQLKFSVPPSPQTTKEPGTSLDEYSFVVQVNHICRNTSKSVFVGVGNAETDQGDFQFALPLLSKKKWHDLNQDELVVIVQVVHLTTGRTCSLYEGSQEDSDGHSIGYYDANQAPVDDAVASIVSEIFDEWLMCVSVVVDCDNDAFDDEVVLTLKLLTPNDFENVSCKNVLFYLEHFAKFH